MTREEEKLVSDIKRIVKKGNHAEVRANKDGSLKVYEVIMKKVAG